MKKLLLILACVLAFSSCGNQVTDSEPETENLPAAVDYQDASLFTSDEFLLALYHNKATEFPCLQGESMEINRKYFSDNCIKHLKQNYEYDGDGLAIWDLFGGSNSSVWGSFKGMLYDHDGWYLLRFAWEETYGDGVWHVSDTPDLHLKVIQVNGRWIIDDYIINYY